MKELYEVTKSDLLLLKLKAVLGAELVNDLQKVKVPGECLASLLKITGHRLIFPALFPFFCNNTDL